VCPAQEQIGLLEIPNLASKSVLLTFIILVSSGYSLANP
jgi:hypothetical protein